MWSDQENGNAEVFSRFHFIYGVVIKFVYRVDGGPFVGNCKVSHLERLNFICQVIAHSLSMSRSRCSLTMPSLHCICQQTIRSAIIISYPRLW